jgi:hypothetical protein
MAIASRSGLVKRSGVIINEHVLTASETRRHVDALSRWFDFIHHDELLDRLARPKARPFCLLTFDDGKRTFATETAPELERLGVPAVIYVATRFLTDQTPLWFDRRIAVERSLGYLPPEIKQEILNAILTCETEASALSDIEQSIAEVSSEIGTPCKSFAFPNGNYTARLARRALEAVAQTVMTIERSHVCETTDAKW